MRLLLFLLLALAMTPTARAQPIELDGIRVYFSGHTGSADLPSYTEFISGTRSPGLFRNGDRTDGVSDGSYELAGLAIDFSFRLPERPRHALSAGFSRETLNTTLFSLPQVDSLSPGIAMSNRAEFFGVNGRYTYRFRPAKRWSFHVGASAKALLPISSRTTQAIDGSENVFFGRRSAMLVLSVPIGFRTRLFPSCSLSFGSSPGLLIGGVDGTSFVSMARGSTFGLHFRIRGGQR